MLRCAEVYVKSMCNVVYVCLRFTEKACVCVYLLFQNIMVLQSWVEVARHKSYCACMISAPTASHIEVVGTYTVHAHQHSSTLTYKLYCTLHSDRIDYKLCFCSTSSVVYIKGVNLMIFRQKLLLWSSERGVHTYLTLLKHSNWLKHIFFFLNFPSLSNVKLQEMQIVK